MKVAKKETPKNDEINSLLKLDDISLFKKPLYQNYIKKNYKTILTRCCEENLINFISHILTLDIDPNYRFGQPLISACKNNSIETVQLLLEQNSINPSIEDNIALEIAIEINSIKLVDLLLSNKKISNSINLYQIIIVAIDFFYDYFYDCDTNFKDKSDEFLERKNIIKKLLFIPNNKFDIKNEFLVSRLSDEKIRLLHQINLENNIGYF